MEYKRDNWEQYKKRLESYGYDESQISAIKEIRETVDLCPDEQFKELVAQGIVVRTRKLKKKRNYYVNSQGQFLYLDHYKKDWQFAGYFKEDDNSSQ